MKTNAVKRAIAMILAALIVLGTLGYFFSVVGFAADEKNATLVEGGSDFQNAKYELRKPNAKIKDNDQVSITIKLDAKSSTVVNDIDGGDVEINGNKSAFEWKQGSSKSFVRDGATDTFVIKFDDLVYKSATNTGKLGFKIKNGSKPEKSVVLDLTSECETSGDPTPPPPDEEKPNPVENTMGCTLWVVRTQKNDDSIRYEFESETKRDSTIRSGYLATFRIRISDPNATPDDIWDGGVGYAKDKSPNTKSHISTMVDRGSFSPIAHDDANDPQKQDGSKYNIISVFEPNGEGNGIVYELELTKLRYSGTGNTLGLTIRSREDTNGTYYAVHQAEVPQCVPYTPSNNNDDDDDPDYSKMEMATPYVIVSNYSYGGQVTAGDTFPLELTFYNTSRNLDVTNMMITISMPDAFMLTSSSNTFYVDQLDAEQSVTQTVQVTVKANAAPQSHNIEVSMKYQYIDDHLVSRRDNSTQETISIPVVQIDRFQVTGVEVSQEIYLNEESYLTVNFVNKGRSDVYNLSAQISGDIQNPGQQQNLGNLTSGSTGTADFYITPNGEGVCTGEVTITYEDTNMEEKTATIQWSTNAVDPMAGMDFGPGMGEFDPGMMEDPTLTDEKKSPTPFIIGGVVIAAGVAAFLIRRRILKKRSEEADANL